MSHAYRTERRQRVLGFTLLEVLVALSVFAVITLLAYRGLDNMASAKARLDHEMRMWRELELVFERIGLDVTQVAPRSWKDKDAKLRSAIQSSTSETGAQCQLDILRFGSDHEPVHARYILKDGKLTLEIIADTIWSAAAQSTPATISQPNLLLDQVERCDLAFLDRNNQWLTHWPTADLADATRPRGMRLRLTLSGRGEFERMYYLP